MTKIDGSGAGGAAVMTVELVRPASFAFATSSERAEQDGVGGVQRLADLRCDDYDRGLGTGRLRGARGGPVRVEKVSDPVGGGVIRSGRGRCTGIGGHDAEMYRPDDPAGPDRPRNQSRNQSKTGR